MQMIPVSQSDVSPARPPGLSFVIPACNEALLIEETLQRVNREAQLTTLRCEIILVDDGSDDDTFARAAALSLSCPLRLIRLSRNFGKEQAIMAGLRKATGARAIILDADLQDDVRHIHQMLIHHAQGYEMIYAVRDNRRGEPWLKRVSTKLFYRLLNQGRHVAIPQNARDFRLMDRRVIDALCALPERDLFMKGLYSWVGFRSKALVVEVPDRTKGRSKFGFFKLCAHALTGLTSFTSWPLRIWAWLGIAVAAAAMLYGVFIGFRTIALGHDVPGWTTLAVALFFLSGLQLTSIGVIGEYLARVFSEVKARPNYIIAEDISRLPE